MTKKWVGQSIKRVEDPKILSGQEKYIDDIVLPKMLYASILRSTYAHAKIKKIDIHKAEKSPGVVTVVTGQDIANMSKPHKPYMGGVMFMDLYPMAVEKTRFVGEPIAAIVATERGLAEDAKELIDVDYEPLEPVSDPEKAMDPSSPIIFESVGSNILWKPVFKFGEPEEAFKNADVIVKEKFELHRYTSSPLEGFGVIANYKSASGELVLWTNTQQMGLMLQPLSQSLGIPGHKIRILEPAIGGGYGIKCGGINYAILISLLAIKSEHPVKWVEEKMENHLAQGMTAKGIFYSEMALKKDGEITALKIKDIEGEGAYPLWASIYHLGKLSSLNGNYKISNLMLECYSVVTNQAPAIPNRAIGKVGVNYLIERMITRASEKIGIDPINIRKRNFIQLNELPYKTPTGQVYDPADYPAALNKLLKAIDYEKLQEEQKKLRNQGKYIGIGIACGVEAGTLNFAYHSAGSKRLVRSGAAEGATVKIELTGNILVRVGSVDCGQGHGTAITQVVADELGVSPDDVQFNSEFDSATNPWTVSSGIYGNKFSGLDMSAVIHATRKLREKALKIAGKWLDVNVDMLNVSGGKIFDKQNPDKSISWSELAYIAYGNLIYLPKSEQPGLECTYYYPFPNADAPDSKGRVRTFLTYASSAHAAIVEVDVETGKIKIQRYILVDDSGTIINPAIVEGQIIGNIFHQLSAALYEEMKYDENGQLVTPTYIDYLATTVKESINIETLFMCTPSPFTPLGTKAVGDGPAIPTPATIVNAVEDALTPFGVKINCLHMSPEKIYNLIQKNQSVSE